MLQTVGEIIACLLVVLHALFLIASAVWPERRFLRTMYWWSYAWKLKPIIEDRLGAALMGVIELAAIGYVALFVFVWGH